MFVLGLRISVCTASACEIECVFVYNFVIACVLKDHYVNTKIGDIIFAYILKNSMNGKAQKWYFFYKKVERG